MLIGVDIGTGGTKSVIFDQAGRILGSGFKEYGVLTPFPAWAEQWPNVWLDGVVDTIKSAVESSGVNSKDILAVAISGLYGGSGIPLDKDKQPLRPCMIWMDRRARPQTQWVKDNIPLEKLFSITGNYVDSYYGFTKMMWMRDNEPDLWRRIYQFSTPKDYIIYHLTGELATDYSSAGNIGGVFDIRQKNWSSEMCKLLGIPVSYLPERITRSHDIVGKLNDKYASLCGLLSGTPIIAGGIDAPVAQFSCGVVDEGEHVAMVGTSMCWGTVHDGKYLTPGLISYPYVVNDDSTIYTFGGGATSGAIIRWFRDQFGSVEQDFQSKTGVSAYSLIEMQSRNIKAGSDGLLVLPYFMGERSPIWDPDARGAVLGLTLLHTKPHLYKAFMEGVAYSLRDNLEAATSSGITLNPDCYMVGGAARSDIWSQIFADVTGYNILRLSQDVEAPFGDAFLAGLGIGVFSSASEIKKWLSFKPSNIVNSKTHDIYNRYFSLYQDFYRQNKDIMSQLASL